MTGHAATSLRRLIHRPSPTTHSITLLLPQNTTLGRTAIKDRLHGKRHLEVRALTKWLWNQWANQVLIDIPNTEHARIFNFNLVKLDHQHREGQVTTVNP